MSDRINHIVAATDPEYLISVGHADELHPLCWVGFGKSDGTIYAEPRFPEVPGLLSVAYPDGQKVIDLRANGFTASTFPKLSHHRSGQVYFTRTGQIDSSVGMTSFPLPSGQGKVFNLKVWSPAQLPLVAKKRRRRGHVDFRFAPALPSAVILTVNWVPIVDMLNEIPATAPMVEPFVNLSRFGNRRMFLARQPRGYPLRSHLLVLHVAVGEVGEVNDLRMFFSAGYDPTKADGESAMIGALYPWQPSDDDASLPSADKKLMGGRRVRTGSGVTETRNNTEYGERSIS